MNASSILLKVGVSEIGRRSFSSDVGGCDFGNMTTFAIFQMRGTSPDCINELNKWQIGVESANVNHAKSYSEYYLVPQIFVY